MDLRPIFSDFFRSGYKTVNEFQQALNESASLAAWAEAVNLWRAGLKKMTQKDLSGLDDIKKANEALKTVVNAKPVEGVDKQLNQLNESVNHFNTDNLDEEIEILEYQLGSLVDKLSENGLTLDEENDDEFELSGCVEPEASQPAATVAPEVENKPEEIQKPVEPVKEAVPMVEPTNAPVAPVTPPVAPTATPAPAASTPAATPAPAAPATPVVEPKKSGFAEGFSAGQARYKKGEKLKETVKKVVEGELCEQPYSFVQRYQEGYAAGWAYAEEVARDLTPHMFEESDGSDN